MPDEYAEQLSELTYRLAHAPDAMRAAGVRAAIRRLFYEAAEAGVTLGLSEPNDLPEFLSESEQHG